MLATPTEMTVKERIRGWLAHDTHPAIQFVKYAVAGGVATGVDLGITFLLSWLVFPALKSDELLVRVLGLHVEPLDAAARSLHFAVNSGIAFIFSNVTAYTLNVLFVFKPGKHSRRKELLLFFAVSVTATLIGTGSGSLVMNAFNLSFVASLGTKVIAALLLNYAGRKYLIFKG